MTKESVNFVLQQVQQYKIPTGHRATPHAQKLYEEGLDIIDSWRGNPHIINQALVAFCETNSRAYASAGIAFALSSAAHISDGKFDAYGAEKALEWLEDAQ